MPKRKTLKQKKSAKFLSIVFFLICLVGLVCVVYIVYFSPLFRVREISFKTNQLGCVSEQELKSSIHLDNNWIILIDKKFESQLKKKFPCISAVILRKILPNKLEIEIIGRQPVAVLKILKLMPEAISASDAATQRREALLDFNNLEANETYIVDKDGVIFNSNNIGNIPTLFVQKIVLKPGQNLDSVLIKNALKLLDGLKILNVGVNDAKIVGNDLVVSSEPKMILALNKDSTSQLASLQLILQEAKIENDSMEFIDMRFVSPVVKYNKKGDK